MRLMPTPRQTCARPADHNWLLLCRRRLPFFTGETCPPLPELLPDVSTATPCRPASGGLTSSCPTCGRARSSVHNVRAHARRAQPGVSIVGESLPCGCRDCFTVILTGTSRAGCHRKRQACLQARRAGRANSGTRDGQGASATAASQTPRAADPPTDHERLRFIHCGNALLTGNLDCDCLGLPQPARRPVCDGIIATFVRTTLALLTCCCSSIRQQDNKLLCDEYWLHFPWTNNPRGVW
ncbi:hypothetical protein TCDM_09385 [Trypanosoma cruzi Dm28c]|uniref:Uncharacterized protein n=1 Tax=Trypanosoma cruzi Dm28c TaxID=1416333 RepID=V5BA12_TRYCR|nr:hypothetical protein TCDM_09385 [Trypanosoma cruzi Dm28c]